MFTNNIYKRMKIKTMLKIFVAVDDCTLLLGTFVELVEREIVLKHKDLLVNTVIDVLKNKPEYRRRRAVPQVHLPPP